MYQVLQSLKSGATYVAEVPVPMNSNNSYLIETSKSLISCGTEKMLIDFGKASYLSKARQQPDKVRQVIEKIKTDGLSSTVDSVLAKLDNPIPMGYCNVGNILETGSQTFNYEVGDRVVSNGHHAQVVSVPMNLCAKVPDSVSDDEASFTVLGAIALQGIRLAKPTLGETIVHWPWTSGITNCSTPACQWLPSFRY